MKVSRFCWWFGIFSLIVCSCSSDKKTMFVELDPEKTGVQFFNRLVETDERNILTYIYFHNGGGVAAGDLNNDGLTDLVFTGNENGDRIYLNRGDFVFEDITAGSGIEDHGGWSTGVLLVDINSDGWNDIYICRSANPVRAKRKNLLYINNKNGTFTEQAAAWGLDDSGYSTHAAFFDYDKDGDLDMFLLNHSLQNFAMGKELAVLKRRLSIDFGSKLYQNNNNVFTDVSEKAGIVSNVISFGLGVAIGDVNDDGWPDIYVSNDFKEQDYLYINNGDGTFSDETEKRLDHLSMFSMGSDMEDINNDGLIDLLTTDMLPPDNFRLKTTAGAENFDKYNLFHEAGFYWQYMRNMLHINNGDGTFSEVGTLAGISSTDWSWAPLFADFDNDGNKDLFVTNGSGRDYTNMDYMKFMVDYQTELYATGKEIPLLELLDRMPLVEINNYIFRNNGDLTFTSKVAEWGMEKTGISSGAAYADLDNDGDLDLIVNNVNDFATIYRNDSRSADGNNYLRIRLQGPPGNTGAFGTRVKMYAGDLQNYREHYTSRGYASSVEEYVHFGLGRRSEVDSVVVVWPDGARQVVRQPAVNSVLSLSRSDVPWVMQVAGPKEKVSGMQTLYSPVADAISFVHEENHFNDFKVQSLLPHFLSRPGPGLAKGDIDGDGLEDLYVGGAKGFAGKLFRQIRPGEFSVLPAPSIESDAGSEDVNAVFFDADSDGDLDLYVVSGGYEFAHDEKALEDRLYLNDGKGGFTKSEGLPAIPVSTACVRPLDIDGDGDLDLFVGGRLVPGRYPEAPGSFLLENDGKGNFVDASERFADGNSLGMVTDAVVADLNGDNWPDLIVVGEWSPIRVLINDAGSLKDRTETYITQPSQGWWNTIHAADFDNDGDLDFVVGNLGLNSHVRADPAKPASIYYSDIDANGSVDPILTYYIGDTSYPAYYLDDLISQVPSLRKKIFYYKDYGKTTIEDILPGNTVDGVPVLTANKFESVVLRNDAGVLTLIDLPVEAQFAPVFSVLTTDVNDDGFEDIVLTGNLTQSRVLFGRYDANHGMLFLGDGKCGFTYVPQHRSGFKLRGDVRSSVAIDELLIFGVNSDSLRVYRREGAKRSGI